ncbi:MAG: fibrobacter succinogenes major paralogous domain-containing protein [Saprospiraceae bacterium]|nr:fibrobacter succinogenes major paralogous domain-containing protein [Saprospiraceae bacterium]
MMKKLILLNLVSFICSFNFSYGQEKLEVEGAIIIRNSEDPTPAPGTIRFNSSNSDFEGWNGLFWATLTGFRLGSVTDIDNNTYKTVTIGSQEWMAENLRVSKYRNGDPLPNVTNDTDWGNLGSGAYCWYNNDSNYEQPYGKLYNWYALTDSRGLCPSGWSEPTDTQWTTLTDFLGGLAVAGGLLKEEGTTHWITNSSGATNESGFTALPGGERLATGNSAFLLNIAYFWSSTESGGTGAYNRRIYRTTDSVQRENKDKKLGYSVRCVRD